MTSIAGAACRSARAPERAGASARSDGGERAVWTGERVPRHARRHKTTHALVANDELGNLLVGTHFTSHSLGPIVEATSGVLHSINSSSITVPCDSA